MYITSFDPHSASPVVSHRECLGQEAGTLNPPSADRSVIYYGASDLYLVYSLVKPVLGAVYCVLSYGLS